MNIYNSIKIIPILFLSLFLFGCTTTTNNSSNIINQEVQIQPSETAKKYVSGILKSVDGGRTWNEKTYVGRDEKNNILTIGDSFVYSIKTSPLDDKILVVATRNNGLYISYDQGENWQLLSGDIGKDIKIYSFSMASPRTFYVGYRNRVYKTVNGGIDWENIYIDKDSDIIEVYNDPEYTDNLYIFTVDGRIIKQNSSGAFVLHNFNSSNYSYGYARGVGIKDAYFYDNNASTNYILFNDNSVFLTTDYGETYNRIEKIPSGLINNLYLYPNKPGSFLLSTSSGLFKTNDNGDSWDEIPLLSVDKNISTLAISKKNRNVIYYSMGNLLYKTVDDGYNWEVIEGPTTKIISSINISPQNNQVIFIGIDFNLLSSSTKPADTNIACDLFGMLFPIFCQ